MNKAILTDLKFTIENPSGTYKKFADTLDEYPILGVTYPTHYGFIEGYTGEDGHALDVFIGNGDVYGTIRVERHSENGPYSETKMVFGVNQTEWDAIKKIFAVVTTSMFKVEDLEAWLGLLPAFRSLK